ncbi:erythrocyte membrane band [Labeo rohita]|uniref:Erythrocyte membrane band n=1 Tax=Labeo rohita TaxID=84645 RepID=A0A498N7K4_LABRO|nr:erythrocyte membrane band [Labeo rohita]
MLLCRVHFLDDTYFEWKLERNSLGQDLFNKVCEHLELLERDYYGLVMWDSSSTRVWLDRAKEIRKQIKSPTAELFFNIKFYPPDPSVLAEDITRYFLCLQLRKDILMGRLPCPPDILALLGSYTVQSTLGDYDPNLHRNNYVSKIVLAPSQSEELEERIMELHSTYRFMSPAQADILFLENAMGLPMYGVDLHPAKVIYLMRMRMRVLSASGWPTTEPANNCGNAVWNIIVSSELDDWFLVYGPDKWRISTTDDVMLDSEKLEEWKHHADDWCVLFDGTPFLLSEVKQPLQFEEQREDVQVVEGSEERLTDELVIKQSYKAQVIQEGSDINVKELPDFELKQEIMKPLKETLNEEVLEVNGERIQRVVITKQWTQEVNSSVESQENADKKIEMLEMVERHVMVTEKKTMGSEGTFETLEVVEQRLEDLDAIKRKLDEVEELRFGLQEVESLEQRLQQVEKVELQQAETDEWYILLDRWPLMLTATPREPLVYQQLQGPTAELYEAKEVIQSRVTTEEQVIEVTTVSAKEEIIVPEKKRTSIIQTPQFPVVPRDIKDDWFQFFDKVPYEQESFPSEIRVVPAAALEAEEKRAVERRRKEEEQIQQQEQVTAVYRQPEPVILEQRAAKPPRDVEDDWFIISDVSPKDSVPLSPQLRGPAVELYEETREEVITSRVRTEEQVTEVITMSAKEQIIVPEKKRTSIIQTPQFPVVPRDIEDDWFQLFDKVPYEQKIFPSDVRIRDFEVHEPIRDQRVVEEQMRETRLVTEEKRVVFDERIERADVVPQMIPVGDRKVDDDWFEILRAPSEMRSVTSVSVATEERRIKEQEERRVRQQEIRVREEEERRLREQEKRKQELEARKAQPVITVKTEAQPQIEKDDDWYILFDVSPKETVVTDVLKVDRRVEEENWRREQERREEERRKQIKIEEATKRPSVPEKKPVQLQTEVEHDWFTLMGVSRKDYVPTIRPTPVISPVAPPKPRPQIPTDQPLTSTPTAKPVSTIKTHEETTKDMWDITLESEKSATESVLMRKSRRSEGESIYTRHSILMLKDLDMSHEMILKHNASVTELKRVFMEVKQEFGPTEWDRRLSSYSPTAKAQLPHLNEEILMRMGLVAAFHICSDIYVNYKDQHYKHNDT